MKQIRHAHTNAGEFQSSKSRISSFLKTSGDMTFNRTQHIYGHDICDLGGKQEPSPRNPGLCYVHMYVRAREADEYYNVMSVTRARAVCVTTTSRCCMRFSVIWNKYWRKKRLEKEIERKKKDRLNTMYASVTSLMVIYIANNLVPGRN